jgi:ribosomal protein L7/L12
MPPALPAAALTALQHGNKIDAIRLVREERKIGLKEAKTLVEAYVESEPTLQARLRERSAATSTAVLRWAGICISGAALILGYVLLR